MPNNFDHIILLIPTYCPPKGFRSHIQKLQAEGFSKIIVVNDGSPDSYTNIFNGLTGITLLTNKRNEGKGFALKVGFRHIKDHFDKSNFVITSDDDGQHAPEDVAKIGQMVSIESGNALYLGSRNFDKNVPLKSQLGNHFMRLLIMILFRRILQDTQTGLRCIPIVKLGTILDIPNNGFSYEIVSLIHFLRTGTYVIEVPIQTIYINNNEATRFRSLSDSANVILSVLTSYFRK
jgi:glycosyltransferase involved in cell wall biosynthesis